MKKERSTRLRWSWLRKIITVAFGLAVFSLAAKPVLAQETVFGPKDLKIGWFGIHFSLHEFTVDKPGEGTIIIGKNTPKKKIRGGFARLNGKWIPLQHFFRGDDLVFEKNVNVRSRNYLFVLLHGDRGASISVEVKKKNLSPPPEVNFSATPAAIKLGEASTLSWTTSYATSVGIEPGMGIVEPSGSQTVTPTETTTYTLTAQGEGGTTSKSVTVTVYQPPTVSISADPETLIYGESSILYWNSTNADKVVIDQNIGEVSYEGSLEVTPDRSTTYTITASGPGGGATAHAALTVKADVEPQPDGSFGKQYEDLVPLDATLDAFDPKRFSVVTGLVRDLAGLPLADVSVTILAHPEYGTVKTDSHGRFSIPVEGGSANTVVYRKTGFITVQRKVNVEWNDIAIAEPIQMITEDPASTTITFNGDPTTVTTHRSTEVVTEINGELKSRSCTMVFAGDNRVYEVDAQGMVTQELSEITARATEFPTVESMPAVLPPTSAFTYCAELSVDGVERVQFAQPVVLWVENFLGFSVGEVVPVGSYDRDRGVWVPEDNGVVVQLLDTDADGLVDAIDADGNSTPDDLDGDGSYSDEVRGLNDGDSYPPGSTFWRAEVKHFSPVDANWPPMLPTGAIASNATRKSTASQQKEAGRDCKNTRCSFVEERSGIFHEDIPIPGTDVTLHYASNGVGGYSTIITVPASGETVPASLSRIVVKVEVAGRVFEQTFEGPPDTLTNKTAEFVWDGRDHLGREVSGLVRAKTRVDFVYPMLYASGRSGASAFGQPGQGSTTIPARVEGTVSKFDELLIQVRSSGGGTIAEGWSLSNHHWLSPTAPSTLYKGDGTLLKTVGFIIETVAGNGKWGLGGDGDPAVEAELPGPTSLKLDAAGNLYITAYFDHVIRKVDSQGIITTVVGTGQAGFNGDGISATTAKINGPRGTTVDREGNLYFADYFNHRVRKVDSKGIITTIAGTGQSGFSGDGGPATQARLNLPTGVAIDASGSIYIVDDHRVRKIDPKGIITTVAGTGQCTYRVTTGPALQASLCYPDDVEVDAAGNIYIADNGNGVVRKVDTSGIITIFAGNQDCFIYNGGNGVPATEACLYSVLGMYVDSSGNVYLADSWNNCIRKVDTNGIITTVAGICGEDAWGYSGDGGPAIEARLDWPWDVEGDFSGNLYVADHNNAVVRKVGLSSAFLAILTDADIPSADPNGLGYIMSSAGHHKRTIDLDTGVVLYEFDYDDDGNLAAMIDRFGNESIVERDEAGLPTAIISPDAIKTTLSIDSNNHLTRISYPDGSIYAFEYTADGLMTAKIEPEGNRFGHVFDESGRLINATDEEGGNWQYSRIALDNGDTLTEVTTAEGEGTSYLDSTDVMGAYVSTITAPTGAQTLFSQSADGRSVTKSLACGMELHYEYDLDSEYKYQYVREMTERTPSGLEKVSVRSKTYRDNDGDAVPEVSTETITVNGKTTTLENSVPQARRTATSPVGRTVATDYDPQNLLTTRLAIPGLLDTTYGYNTRGRLTEIATGSRVTTLTYDPQGNVESITDPENHTTTYTYDAVGRMTGINRPDGSSLGFSYDNNGNMTVLTNPANIAHYFGYNKVNLNSSYQTPASGSHSYVYDKDRRLTQVNFPSGKQIENLYANGRLEQIQTPEGNIDLTYLCGNKVDTITKGLESVSYGYDGSLVTAENLSGTLNNSLSYGYNGDFNLASFTYAGATISYSYDNDGLLTGAGSFTIDRNAENGLPESVTGGSLHLSRVFNGYGEVGGQNFSVAGQGLTSWNLTRDDAGRITAKTETFAGVPSHYIYTYDPMGRLRTVTKDGTLFEEYQYDSVGTRIYEMNALRGIVGRSMTYDDEDHLLTAGDAVYQYDADGYLTSRTVGIEPPYEVTSYLYSSRGELLRVNLPSGSAIEYVHDPLGRRIAKKVDGVITEKYLWQGMTRLLAVYDGTGNLLMRFLYADGRMPVAMERGGALYYLTYDQVGTLRVVADGSGSVVKQIEYDSFGNILSDTNLALEVPFGFAGGLHDRDTGLVRFGFRDYDPDTSRWTAKDPILFAGGNVDLYGYCLNDPVNWVDPYGFSAVGDIYTGVVTAISEGVKGAAYSVGHASKDIVQLAVHGDPYVKTALGIAVVSEAAPLACAAGYYAAPTITATTIATFANPSAIELASDFVQGAIPSTAPPPTIGGALGTAANILYNKLF
jgi:RHS repeat-associated protein